MFGYVQCCELKHGSERIDIDQNAWPSEGTLMMSNDEHTFVSA